jgi:hypothetical protein
LAVNLRRYILLVLTALGVLFSSGRTSSSGPYHDSVRHFSLVVPDEWKPMDPQGLTLVNRLVQELRPGTSIRYQSGFQLRDRAPASYPYVLVRVELAATRGASYDDVEKSIGRALKIESQRAEDNLPWLIRNLSVGEAVLDRTRDRVVLHMQMEVVGFGKVHCLSTAMLGSDEVVFLLGYAREAEFEKYRPAFEALADSFRYDPGHAFVAQTTPVHTRPPGARDLGADFGSGLIGGVLCGLVAGGVALIIRLFGWLYRRVRALR